jgi:hypothetical protein
VFFVFNIVAFLCRHHVPVPSPISIDPNQTDALLEVVTQQITLLTFDETDEDILMQLVNALADPVA